MIRLVVGVVLAAALLAASLPAIEDARVDRTNAQVETTTSRLRVAAASLLATDAAVVGPGARRVVTVRLPDRTLTSAAVRSFVVRCRPFCTVVVDFEGGHRRTFRLDDLPFRTPAGPIRLDDPGPHRLVLGLRPAADGPVVTVRVG